MYYMDHSDKDKIEALRRAVEQRLGHGVNTPSEFSRLSLEIEQRTGRTMSVSTLMRLWGYVSSQVKPNVTTLDVLAVYAGYRDYASFASGDEADGSDEVMTDHLDVDRELEERDHVLLRWQPGRECLVRYMGGGQWVVERSLHSKLAVGDTFTCHLIIQGHPLYLDNLVHQSMPPRCYVCGQKGGVQYEVLRAEDVGTKSP